MSLRFLLVTGVALFAGCTPMPPPSGGDMAGPGHPDLAPPGDMGESPLAGIAGAPCKDPKDCFRLKNNPVCWNSYLFNVGITYPTPGGYCSTQCQDDSDCGPGGKCQEFDVYGKWCFAGCSDAHTCRHPGYACTLDFQICYPETMFDCDPTQNGGKCMAQVDVDPKQPRVAGGCLRAAFEDKGQCNPTCTLDPGQHCPVNLASQQLAHCLYLDTTVDLMLMPTQDKWKGLVCVPDGVPNLDGKECHFFEDCFEGSQCDLWPGGDGRCHPLCVQGGTPMCAAGTGTCQDALRAGAGGPGLCK